MSNTEKESLINYIVSSLEQNLEKKTSQWCSNEDFITNYFYIDNLIPDEVAKKIFSEINLVDDKYWFSRSSFRERKKEFVKLDIGGKILSDITEAFHNQKVIDLITKITKIGGLESDPSLFAGGITRMDINDFLNPHIDNSHDSKRKKFRRLNLLYYLSPNWSLKNGGNFELWNKQKTKPITIVSKFNRLVIMETNKQSWHSVSMVKSNKPRCCISNYYYSNISPNKKQYFHVTSFAGRPEENIKKKLFIFDNFLRNFFSRITRIGRGKNNVNKKF